jgi:hypothetical protein
MSVCDVEREHVSSLKKPTVLTIKGLPRDSLVRSVDGRKPLALFFRHRRGFVERRGQT